VRWHLIRLLRPPAVLVPLTALAVGGMAGRGWTGVLATMALVFAAWLSALLHDRSVRRSVSRLEALGSGDTRGSVPERLADGVTRVEAALAAGAGRAQQRHAVSGLPTREPLLAAMDEDGAGTLGAIAFADYDRLSAFDPALANRVLLALVARVLRMVPDGRMVAHVDRAHLAIWFGSDVAPADATAGLRAIGYALGDAVADGAREIVPEVAVREVRHDGGSAPVSLFRVLSAFALPGGAEGAVTAIDPVVVARDRYALEQDLRQAVARGEFRLNYQPLVDAEAGRVTGAEALIRWHHPRHGLIPPTRFVPIMEEAGLADEIGAWALNVAVREAKGWQRQGLGTLAVAVNVSGCQLEADTLPMLVARTLERHDLAASCLELELTESVAMGDGTRAARLFEVVREGGVRIAIDDFGTGYSSFATLRSLAFDKIKIDRAFVTHVDTRRDNQAICRSILALGQGLGIRVLAEGVERPEELGWLRRAGCRHFQGYWFSAPLEPSDFVAFVRDLDRLRRRLESPSIERLIA
jgi:Amt family ammonium transporter